MLWTYFFLVLQVVAPVFLSSGTGRKFRVRDSQETWQELFRHHAGPQLSHRTISQVHQLLERGCQLWIYPSFSLLKLSNAWFISVKRGKKVWSSPTEISIATGVINNSNPRSDRPKTYRSINTRPRAYARVSCTRMMACINFSILNWPPANRVGLGKIVWVETAIICFQKAN